MIRIRRRITVLSVLAVTVAVAVVLVVIGVRFLGSNGALVAAPEVATASSASLGHPAANALPGANGRSGWQPDGDAVDAWWGMRWDSPVRMTTLRIEQPTSGDTVQRVMLAFGDGTRVMAGVAGGVSQVAFSPRSVNAVRVILVATTGQKVRLLRVAAMDRTDAGTPIAADSSSQGIASVAAITDGATAVRTLTDGDASGGLGAGWSAQAVGGVMLTLQWTTPHEIDALELYGTASGRGRVQRGVIDFGGDQLPIGGVLADPKRPTQVAFVPRVVTTMRIQLFPAVDTEAVRLAELRVMSPGNVLTAPATDSGAVIADSEVRSIDCRSGDARAGAGVSLVCPATGTIVRGATRIIVSAPRDSTLDAAAWSNDGARAQRATVKRVGRSATQWSVKFDAAALAPGPITVSVGIAGSTAVALLGFYNGSAALPATRVDPRSLIGGSLVYSEEFDGRVTASRDGSGGAYTAAKPEVDGVSDFGEASFADPATAGSTLSTVGGSLLQLAVRPQAGSTGPYSGALLASSRSGGSGFSAEYGYFEARMYVPIATGSWPAFWLLPASNLAKPQPDVAEFDAVELYGHDPKSACSSTHHYDGTETPGGVAYCGQRFSTLRVAAEWHTYGVQVGPGEVTFFIDGKLVATAAQVPGGAQPMFFLADLALGGGWPVDLSSQRGDLQMYIDYIRVYE